MCIHLRKIIVKWKKKIKKIIKYDLICLKAKYIYFLGMNYEELRDRISNYGKLSYRNGYRDGYFEGLLTGCIMGVLGALVIKSQYK